VKKKMFGVLVQAVKVCDLAGPITGAQTIDGGANQRAETQSVRPSIHSVHTYFKLGSMLIQ
jgi:hypothetical protein